MRSRRARRSLAYEALNRPWRLVNILRAVRVGRRAKRERELDLAAWAIELNRENRRERKRAMLRAMYSPDEPLSPWMEEVLLDLAEGDRQTVVALNVPRQHS